MILTVNHDGRVIGTEVVQARATRAGPPRHGHRRSAGPFGRFNDAMRRQADQIVVVSRFRFTRDETLETNLTSR
jgi:protein TonB